MSGVAALALPWRRSHRLCGEAFWLGRLGRADVAGPPGWPCGPRQPSTPPTESTYRPTRLTLHACPASRHVRTQVKPPAKEGPITSQPQPSSAAALPPAAKAPPKGPTPSAAPPPSAPPPSAPPPADDEDTFQITVPEGVQPGEKLKATTPSGVKVLLRVPEGAGPGTELNFTLPKGTSTSKVAELDADAQAVAATKIQARIRGKSVRKASAVGKPAGAPPKPPQRKAKPAAEQDDMTKAAVKVQSIMRGHSVRYEQEEVRATRRALWGVPLPNPNTHPAPPLVACPLAPRPFGRTTPPTRRPLPHKTSRVSLPSPSRPRPSLRPPPLPLYPPHSHPPTPTHPSPPSSLPRHAHLANSPAHPASSPRLPLQVRRLEWMKYYMQPDVAEYDKALELTCTPEEEQAVEDAKQENSRVQWMEFFVASGKLTEARELGWDGKNPPPPGGGSGGGLCAVFAKCFAPSGGEEKRKADFVKAVRNYEWDLAASLAVTAEEKQDVADSKNRVEWMDYHTAQGDMEEALTYAITSEERMRVESATKQAKVIG